MNLDRLTELPAEVASDLGLPGAIIIGVSEHGDIVVHAHGTNHQETVRCLSVAIHAVLSQHDDLVRRGAAGKEAADRAKLLM